MNKKLILCNLILLTAVSLAGCNTSHVDNDPPLAEIPPNSGELNSDSDKIQVTYRDNTPKVLIPEAPGTKTSGNELVNVDYSNISEGYVIIDYFGTNDKIKLQITGPEGITITYDFKLSGEAYPLSQGSGTYKIVLFEHAYDTQYTTAFSDVFEADITNEFGPFLYTTHTVVFDRDSECVAKAEELAAKAENDIVVIENVFNYILDNLSYDHEFADVVTGDYIPTPDKTFKSNKGICSDYATLMAAMLRSQGIPTRLEVGYVDEEYHEWVSVYTKEYGWLEGIIHFDGQNWVMMDPTMSDSMGLKDNYKFITSGEHYTLKFIY